MDNIVGTQVGIYNVLSICEEKAKDGHKLYNVECQFCGFKTKMKKSDIGRASKCIHLLSNTKIFVDRSIKWNNIKLKCIFHSMKNRCYNENEPSYRWYGAKGIKICDEWLNNPKLFEEWAMNNGYVDNLTIDRINECKDYCPENCRWITNVDNAKYKSTTHLIDVDGIKHTGRDWANVLKLGTNTINTMFRNNDEEIVKEFIRRRLNNLDLCRRGNQSWFCVYGLD